MESNTPISDGPTTDADTAIVMALTVGDTTWRMFVPSIGFTLLGVWLDISWGSKPWLMILGIIIGVAGAVLLVRQQIIGIKRRGRGKA